LISSWINSNYFDGFSQRDAT